MIDTVEYPLRIEHLSRDTIPMVRLAEYLSDFAKLLGSPDQVHFEGVRSGSAVLVARVEEHAKPLVSPRLRAVARGEGPADAMSAWRRINERLTDDKTTASLTLPGGEVIMFLGAPKPERPMGPISQPTAIQGRLIRLEGTGDAVSVGIDDDAGISGKILISAERAQALGSHFQRYVRLTGMGKWKRTSEGQWLLERLEATAFEVLDDTPLPDLLRRVRDLIPTGAAANAIEMIKDLRRP
ncbi:hypothetical protein AB4037_17825 [Labrys sp. KB_33_2]|uniref:hypothetical protein n=1 Tax=Labrys sp. KB_33_2 TaxID=3237479 RepID=UPI003F92CFD5